MYGQTLFPQDSRCRDDGKYFCCLFKAASNNFCELCIKTHGVILWPQNLEYWYLQMAMNYIWLLQSQPHYFSF